MHFQINHTTRYTYSKPVFLEPHTVRLRPRMDASQHLHQYDLTVQPTPRGLSEGLDAENNGFSLLWFEGLHDHLEIAVAAEVDTSRTNPYEGLLTEGADRLPIDPPWTASEALRPYLKQEGGGGDEEPLRVWAQALVDQADRRTLDFLYLLNTRLHLSMEKVTRLEPGNQSPSETLRKRRGACRDLALLFMAACRCSGIPARFVSGYQLGNPQEPDNDLHAWAEVYLPGLGWRGYDPTHGLLVADSHVALAAASIAAHAAPVVGAFRGTGIQGGLTHRITMAVGNRER